MVPVPGPVFCTERQRLVHEFTAAASEYLHLKSRQLHSVTLGRGYGFEAEIKAACQRKDEARLATLKHQREHGC
jgi:hypothetical protein